MKRARAIAVLGTGSSVGKSLLAAGLCRLLVRRGLRVAPFKAQNMSNNAAVTADGGEMGRAQVVQALACNLAPHVDMNPILLKPESDGRSQVIVSGRAVVTESARDYYRTIERRTGVVHQAYDRLAAAYDAVVLEGAGSCAELNLADRDLVNLPMAEHADARVVLVGDIERGGVFAQLIGTLELLAPAQRARVAGLIVNKFRGDRSLFDDGVEILEARTGLPVFGVVPRLMDLHIDDEDGADILDPRRAVFATDTVNIAVVGLPRISNMSDFTALDAEPDVALRYAHRPSHLGGADVVCIPGTKATLADLEHLDASGLGEAIVAAAGEGAHVIGVCGGLQILGRRVRDPDGVEGGGERAGLGLLPVDTVLRPGKITARRDAVAHIAGDRPARGYEIHCGETRGDAPPAFTIAGQPDGAVGHQGRVWGTYLHGLFDDAAVRRTWLNRVRADKRLPPVALETSRALDRRLERELDRWADHLAEHLADDTLDRLLARA